MGKSIPKYEMIKLDLINKINNNELQPHQVIPSENELSEMYHVSRVTVRKAIDELVKESYIYKKRGKGSFVSSKDFPLGISRIHSYTELITLQGKTAKKVLITQQVKKPSKKIANRLKINEDDDVYEIECLYLADDMPLCINKSILPCVMFPKLDYFDCGKNSLYEILKEFYKLEMSKASQYIEAVLGNEQIYTLLQTKQGYPLLKLNVTSYCLKNGEERPFEVYEAYIKTDVIGYFVETYN
ncbi:GntR family transcriptional regulator [Bacillus massiliigorillae]|uniref:GntR family transcriptional regulator n=1 Tax=Bacillus massiliigorillae TaxID=1243664 RepID=UPI00039BAB78|nr:GntR family transcriptional regulator [Bacillus massiliigorillae]